MHPVTQVVSPPYLQVWNSDTLEEARKSIQSELVSDEPEMRLLYTTPGVWQPPAQQPGQHYW